MKKFFALILIGFLYVGCSDSNEPQKFTFTETLNGTVWKNTWYTDTVGINKAYNYYHFYESEVELIKENGSGYITNYGPFYYSFNNSNVVIHHPEIDYYGLISGDSLYLTAHGYTEYPPIIFIRMK